MFPILNVGNLGKGKNKMSESQSQLETRINQMSTEEVMREIPFAQTELNWTMIKKVLLWLAFAAGLSYVVFGM